jgi:hypothetical protein
MEGCRQEPVHEVGGPVDPLSAKWYSCSPRPRSEAGSCGVGRGSAVGVQGPVRDRPAGRGGVPDADPREPGTSDTPRASCPTPPATDNLDVVTDETVELELDEAGLATDLPRPESPADEVQQVPYRPVQFRDDDLPAALERSAAWLRRAQQWLGEPLDVIAIHLDYDDRAGSPYYEVKLLCNEEDLAGAPLAVRRVAQSGGH